MCLDGQKRKQSTSRCSRLSYLDPQHPCNFPQCPSWQKASLRMTNARTHEHWRHGSRMHCLLPQPAGDARRRLAAPRSRLLLPAGLAPLARPAQARLCNCSNPPSRHTWLQQTIGSPRALALRHVWQAQHSFLFDTPNHPAVTVLPTMEAATDQRTSNTSPATRRFRQMNFFRIHNLEERQSQDSIW
jgi:hypothetical protein